MVEEEVRRVLDFVVQLEEEEEEEAEAEEEEEKAPALKRGRLETTPFEITFSATPPRDASCIICAKSSIDRDCVRTA